MNSFELFAQVIFLLRFLDARAHLLRDLAFQFGNFQLGIQAFFKQFKPFGNVVHL